MKRIKILSLPKLEFAHVYSTSKQKNTMSQRPHQIEITYISDGVLNYDGNGHFYSLKKGDVICNLFTKSICFSSDVFHEHHTVGFTVDFEICDSEDITLPALPFCLINSASSDEILNIIDRIIKNRTIYPENALKCSGLFLELINLISNEYTKNLSFSNYSEIKYVKKAKKYIYEHIHEPIMQKNVARHLAITPEYLCSIFKKSEGCSLINYVNRIKLEKVKALMEQERITLQKASELYGFTDPSYVSRLYKKHYKKSITNAIAESNEQ